MLCTCFSLLSVLALWVVLRSNRFSTLKLECLFPISFLLKIGFFLFPLLRGLNKFFFCWGFWAHQNLKGASLVEKQPLLVTDAPTAFISWETLMFQTNVKSVLLLRLKQGN